MNRRGTVFALLAFGAAGVPLVSRAQQQKKLWRVGVVWGQTRLIAKPYEDAFLAGMKDHGYEVGRNLIFDTRHAEGDQTRYPSLADEILALKPDALLGSNTAVSIVLKSKTAVIPIVTSTTNNPVDDGLAQSLARPGGNVTGMAVQLDELIVKHIELLAEMLPRMRRVAVLLQSGGVKTFDERFERLANKTAAARNLVLQVHRAYSVEEIRQAFRLMEAQRSDALVIAASPRFNTLRREIAEIAAGIRLPSIAFLEEYPQDGGLMSYGPSFVEATRRTAYFMDRIFKGTKPGDLPIEQPTKFTLAVNARTAKALGIRIPDVILLRADRVIE